MSICVPMKELKNTAAFTDTVCNSPEPVIVTKNGHEAFISMSPAVYESLRREAARSELYRMVDRSERDIESGRLTDALTSNELARARYGL